MGRRKKTAKPERAEPTRARAEITLEPENWRVKAAALFLLTVAVYIPAMSGGYLIDDAQLLYQNSTIRRGEGFADPESWKGLWSIWVPQSADDSSDYWPLAGTAYWLQWRLWGNNHWDENLPDPNPAFRGLGAPGYHVTNIVFHAAAALLLWRVLKQLGVPYPWVVALVWAIHPVNVESVAWIAELKNPLSMVLVLLTMLAWLRFQDTRRWGAYGLTVFLFLCALLAKTSVVMLPVALLVCSWWPRKRVTLQDLRETAPFFLLSLILGLVTVYFQHYRGAERAALLIGGPLERLGGACFATGFYLYKTLYPVNLVFIYPEWHKTLPQTVGGLLLELAIGAALCMALIWAWLRRETWGRHVIFGMGFFVIMLLPVLGLMEMAYMRYTLVADHFQYVPMVGALALGVAGLGELYRRMEARYQPAFRLAGVGLLALFAIHTWQRAALFSDEETLWRDTLSKNPDCWIAQSALGGILYARADFDAALPHLEKSAALAPQLVQTHVNYGVVLGAKGRTADALIQFSQALDIDPKDYTARLGYANSLFSSGRAAETIEQFQEAARLAPGNPTPHTFVGLAYLKQRDFDRAIASFDRSLELAPNQRDVLAARARAIQMKQASAAPAAEPQSPNGEASR